MLQRVLKKCVSCFSQRFLSIKNKNGKNNNERGRSKSADEVL